MTTHPQDAASMDKPRRRPAPTPLALTSSLNDRNFVPAANKSPRVPSKDPVKASGYAIAKSIGLPASASLDSSLNTLALSTADFHQHASPPASTGMARSASGYSQSSSSPESPRHVDRTTLVGLGELTTPRWKTANWGTLTDFSSSQVCYLPTLLLQTLT